MTQISAFEKNKLPLITALLQLNTAGRFSWHMPGHHSGRQWPVWLRDNLHLLDTTELSSSDDLMAPTGPALESLRHVSELCGAGWSRYLTCGSTSGILAMLAAYPGRGGRVLMSPVCHQSVMHAAALLDFEIGWIKPDLWPVAPTADEEPLTLLPQVGLADVQKAAADFGAFDAVFLTSPDYYGSCAEVKAIAEFAHARNASVLVDEAHGAHLSVMHQALPVSALRQGADICVQSLHKTLPALTPAAMLHVSAESCASGRVDLARVQNALKVFHTTSPSFVIAASAEYAEYWLHEYAGDYVEKVIDRISRMAVHLDDDYVFAPVDRISSESMAARDPLRVVLQHRDRRDIGPTARFLASKGIDVEMNDTTRLVLIPAIDQTEEEFAVLTETLLHASRDCENAKLSAAQLDRLHKLDSEWRHLVAEAPDIQIAPGNAMLCTNDLLLVDLDAAAGYIAAGSVVPYPPGIPLVWPGEKLSPEKLDFINKLGENGVNLIGTSNKKLHVLCR